MKSRDSKPIVVVFGRNVADPNIVKQFNIEGFEPYFYAPADAIGHPRGLKKIGSERIKDALGRDVIKITTNLPSDVPRFRQAYEWTDEADVLFDIRFMIDHKIKYGFRDNGDGTISSAEVDVLLPRIMFFDIEVRSPPEIVPDPKDPIFPIVSIQIGDSYTREIVIFTSGVPQIAEDQLAYQDEGAMLVAVMEYIQQMNFDVLSGWYSNGFDIPYIINRLHVLGIPTKKLTRFPFGYYNCRAEPRGREWMIRIPGRQCLDMMDAFKKWYKAEGELEKYDLKSVASKFADFTYTDYGAHIDKMFNNNEWEEFLQYCRNDVIALMKIDDKLKLFDFYEHLRMKTGVKLEDTMKNSKMIESLLFHFPNMKPMPTRRYDIKSESYSGALVITPEVGLHSNVGVFDLAALYPTIIRAFEVSPDVDKVIPIVIVELMEEREKLRELKKKGLADESTKKKEVVVKFLVNSFYGVLGWPMFRLYKPEMALFITSTGQEINRFLQKCALESGHPAVYGDTDSVFLKGIPDEQVGFEMQDYLNARLVEWANEHQAKVAPTLKFEKLYRKILFKQDASGKGAAKKRYAGHLISKDGEPCSKLSYTGIELKRSDQAEITRTVLQDFLTLLLLHDDEEGACKVVKQAVKAVREGNIDCYSISIPRGVRNLQGNDPWSRGVRRADEILNLKFPPGVKPRLIYTKGEYSEICIDDTITDDVLISHNIQIDYKVMQQKVIEGKLRSFVESIGRDWDKTVNGQTSLFDFAGETPTSITLFEEELEVT
jgi:DNA polymerase elongation subunit (family B)